MAIAIVSDGRARCRRVSKPPLPAPLIGQKMQLRSQPERQDDPRPEHRHPESGREGDADQIVRKPVAPHRGDQRKWRRDQHRQNDRVDHEEQRDRQPADHDPPHVRLIEIGDAEIAMQGVAEEMQILAPERQIEAELIRIRAISCGVARLPSTAIAGSPGIRRTSRKTTRLTPNRTGRNCKSLPAT